MEFMYGVPSQLIFKEGIIREIESIVKEQGVNKLLCICCEESENMGIVDDIIEELENGLIKVFKFNKFGASATNELMNEAIEIAKEKGVQGIIAIGNYGAMNLAKAVNVSFANEGIIREYEGYGNVKNATLPLIAVPVGAGITASITTSLTVFNEEVFKGVTVGGRNVAVDISLIDPSLAKGLSKKSRSIAAMNALSYAIESYYAKDATLVTEMHAKKAIELIALSIKNGKKDKPNVETLALGCVFAGLASDSSSNGLNNSITNALCAHYGKEQALLNAIMLPHIVKYNGKSDLPKTKKIAKIMKIDIEEVDDKDVATKVGEGLLSFSEKEKIPSLRDIGILDEEFEIIAEDVLHESSTYFNPDIPSKRRILEILGSAIKY